MSAKDCCDKIKICSAVARRIFLDGLAENVRKTDNLSILEGQFVFEGEFSGAVCQLDAVKDVLIDTVLTVKLSASSENYLVVSLNDMVDCAKLVVEGGNKEVFYESLETLVKWNSRINNPV